MRVKSSVSFEPPPTSTEAEWREWMAGLGRDFRVVRQFLGLSQDELARHSGVSQGAVSRLESGQGVHTPFSVLVKVNVVLATALREFDPASLSADVRAFLAFMDYLAPPRFRGSDATALSVGKDETLERLIRLYHALPDARRAAFVKIMSATAKCLAD